MTDDTKIESTTLPTILGEGVDQQGRRFAVFGVGGERIAVAYEDISDNGRIWSILLQKGARIFQSASKRALLKNLEETHHSATMFDVASSVGWQFGVFVLPNRIIGAPKRELVLALDHLPQDMLSKYRAVGSLNGWQGQILPPCNGNSRLIFAVCWGISSAVASLIPEAIKTGATQIYGDQETGKTTGGMVAGSHWGCHYGGREEKGFCEDWNTTVEKVEDTASAHSDVGLILDETNLNDKVPQIAWRLAEGSWKQRKNERATSGFSGFLFSTSNHPLWKLAAGSEKKVDDALLSRFLDIPVGLFENLNGFDDPELLVNAIKERCRAHFGVAGPAFIERLIADREADPEAWFEYVRKRRAYYQKILRRRAKKQGLRFSGRTADRMATVYTTGRLAEKYGIIFWDKKTILNAVLSCHVDALRQVQPFLSANTKAPTSPRAAVVEYFRREMTSFIDLDERSDDLTDDDFEAAKGFSQRLSGKKWFYLTFRRFKRVVGSLAGAKTLLAELSNEGLCGHNIGNSTAQRRIGGKMRRVVAIRRKIIKADAPRE